jgi:hypothetical protein
LLAPDAVVAHEDIGGARGLVRSLVGVAAFDVDAGLEAVLIGGAAGDGVAVAADGGGVAERVAAFGVGSFQVSLPEPPRILSGMPFTWRVEPSSS